MTDSYYPHRVTVAMTTEMYDAYTRRMTTLTQVKATGRSEDELVIPILNGIHRGHSVIYLGDDIRFKKTEG